MSDTLNSFGLRHQALRPFVRLRDATLALFGRACTGRYAPEDLPPDGHNHYKTAMELPDSRLPGEVAVLACDGLTDSIAPWGGLLSTATRAGMMADASRPLVAVAHCRALTPA